MPRMLFRGVILDIDGTLVNTNDAHAHAWVEAFRRNGRPDITFEQVRPLIGMGGDQLLPRVAGIEKDTPEGKRLANAWTDIFAAEYVPKATPLPGASDLLRRLHAAGFKLAVASSGEQHVADALLDLVGAKPYLAAQATSKDAERSKPAPDIVQAALDKLGLPPAEVVMIGDTPYDIEAAHAAGGVNVIAFRSGGFGDKLSGALAVYDDPADLLAHFDESPLAPGGGGNNS